MSHRFAITLLLVPLAACGSPRQTPARLPNADSAAAVTAERAADPPPANQTADRKQLVHAMHELSITISNARTSPRDTADAPRWNGKLDAIANELPDPPTEPDAAAAYQLTRNALQMAHQMRLAEAYAYIDTAFKTIPDR